jgi:type IV fimbrial biogenesis protein FimT
MRRRGTCSSSKTLNQQRGVTMIEACITLSIAGILAGSALPSFKDSLDKRKVEGLSYEVGTDLRYARSDAVALKTVNSAEARGAQVVANVSSLRFDPTNGTTSPTGTVCTVPASGRSVHNVVSLMGRVRTCSPATAGAPCAPC